MYANDKAKVGARVRELRNQKGLSQEKLALAADIDRTYIASVESGKRNISIVNLEKLIVALDTSFAEFFEGNVRCNGLEYKYIVNNNNRIIIRDELILSNQQILQAINFCNQALQKLDRETKQFDINILRFLECGI
ncbi:MAG: helix-turn-helix domain-containing protein [Lachnospiraceae bacterium]